MLNRSAKTATYGEDVASRIEILFSEDFLLQIDDAAARAGESRAEFLHRSVEDEVRRNQAQRRKVLEELLEGVEFDLGGKTAAELIREGRDSR